jgi:hypothetical protein
MSEVLFVNFMYCGPCIAIFFRNKTEEDALFYSQYISKINLYVFRTGLRFIIRSYYSVYTEIVTCHALIMSGC